MSEATAGMPSRGGGIGAWVAEVGVAEVDASGGSTAAAVLEQWNAAALEQWKASESERGRVYAKYRKRRRRRR